MRLAVVGPANHRRWDNHEAGMTRQLKVPRCGNVVRLAGGSGHSYPIQSRPVAGAWRPPGRAAGTGNGEATVGQPSKNDISDFDLTVVARLCQICVPIASDEPRTGPIWELLKEAKRGRS
eukprot:3194169-Alexandrium_andersonii.AAC.1